MKLFPIQFQIIVTHPYASTNNMHMLSSCLLLIFDTLIGEPQM